jgi:hypothetical protein
LRAQDHPQGDKGDVRESPDQTVARVPIREREDLPHRMGSVGAGEDSGVI